MIIRPGGIGDAVLLVPTILLLKRKFPDATIDILAEKRNADIFDLCPAVNSVYCYDKLQELNKALRGPYDVVIDSEQWHRLSAVAAGMTRAKVLIGYDTNERKKLFTHRILYSHTDYEMDSFLNLLGPLISETKTDADRPFLVVPRSIHEKVGLFQLPMATTKNSIALFSGASIQERKWGKERFHKLAEKLVANGFGIVIIGGKNDIDDAQTISKHLSNSINVCGQLTLIETAAVLSQVSLLISGDSGILHVGYGLGIKTLSLFGPGIEKKWAPRGKGHMVMNKRLPCSPCTKFGYTPRCKINAACMKQISVEEVYNAAIKLLEGE
jgi:ADP-heptose:LPS heptosyltransferase